MEKQQKDRVRFFFKFINLDLERLSDEEKSRTCFRLALYCDWPVEVSEWTRICREAHTETLWIDPDEEGLLPSYKELFDIQDHLARYFFDTMVPRIRTARRVEERHSERNEFLLENDDPLRIGEYSGPITFQARFLPNETRTRGARGLLDGAPLVITTVPPRDASGVVLKFLEAIAGFELHDFDQCEECGKWFVRVTRKDKRFCSHVCSARKGNRDRYRVRMQSNPEAHERALRDGQDRAHKSYERKTKAKHGPRVKVERRPRKKKQEEA
jgi:hypothetical protein